MNLQETWSIQNLDKTVNYYNRPTLDISGIGTIKVAPVVASPGHKVTSYWAQNLETKILAFAETPSKAVWMMIGKMANAASCQ